MKTFEQTLLDIGRATDGQGHLVRLFTGEPNAAALREATRDFAEGVTRKGVVFLGGINRNNQLLADYTEAAAWENLALLANATAAAIREGT